jgi:hypothetical protein
LPLLTAIQNRAMTLLCSSNGIARFMLHSNVRVEAQRTSAKNAHTRPQRVTGAICGRWVGELRREPKNGA